MTAHLAAASTIWADLSPLSPLHHLVLHPPVNEHASDMSAYAYGLKQVVQVVTVVTRLFSLANFCHHLVTAVSIFCAATIWRVVDTAFTQTRH